MKQTHLAQIITTMTQFTHIERVYRISDTQIRIEFDKRNAWTFDMRGGNAMIFISPNSQRTKTYNAPFDVLLAKRLNRSTIHTISLHNGDKMLRMTVTQNGAYKSETTLLQLEFTGKYTNAILLDKDEVVLEALRHIDEMVSVRSVRVGEVLVNPPRPEYTPVWYPLENVEEFLRQTYELYASSQLAKLKKEKKTLLLKRLTQLRNHREALSDEATLLHEAHEAQYQGQLILANLHRIKGYETHLTLEDFTGETATFEVPKGLPTGARMADALFKKGKKAKQKGVNLFKERDNLEEKIRYLELFYHTIEGATTPQEIALLFPQKVAGTKAKPKATLSDGIAEFWIEGVKVSLGKSERGNIQLLQRARAKDVWLHLKDRPSAHVIITTDKQELPLNLIHAAAKLCVDFSVFEKGSYLVDYTPRREVRIQEGANVLYTKYQTVMVEK